MINNNKTKYLYCTRRAILPTYIDIGKEQFGQVNSFKYLGAMVNITVPLRRKLKKE